MNIPLPLLQAIANYLQTRPFNEVVWFLTELGKLTPPAPDPEVKEVSV